MRGRLTLLLVAGGTCLTALPLLAAQSPRGYFDGSLRARYALRPDSLYQSPITLALARNGRTLYVVCENTDQLLRVDLTSRRVTGAVRVGRRPFDVALSLDGRTAYVTNRWDDDVTVVDLATLQVERTFPTGFNPHGVACDSTALYVANMSADNISVIDLRTGKEDRRLLGGRQPFAVAVSPDGRTVGVTSQLSVRIPFRATPRTEVTFIDAARRFITDHRMAENCVIQQGATWTPETSPQHEPWGYFVDHDDGDSLVYAALWGGGLMEYDLTTGRWKSYLDPDGEMEIDLYRDDGIVHVITTGVSAREGIVWVSTYFGLSSYDHKRWRGYMDHDTGLASNFINHAHGSAPRGSCTAHRP